MGRQSERTEPDRLLASANRRRWPSDNCRRSFGIGIVAGGVAPPLKDAPLLAQPHVTGIAVPSFPMDRSARPSLAFASESVWFDSHHRLRAFSSARRRRQHSLRPLLPTLPLNSALAEQLWLGLWKPSFACRREPLPPPGSTERHHLVDRRARLVAPCLAARTRCSSKVSKNSHQAVAEPTKGFLCLQSKTSTQYDPCPMYPQNVP
jgi:hypothetical protein